ncbi:MAG TPA: histone deacetylase [Vicinamibacterales bacterium]|nr:histone deacetylase [Vicinamibacterales bacterium]
MPVILIHSDRFAEHQTPPGHPERPERAEVMDAVADRWRLRGAEIVAPRAATVEQLARVHDRGYLRRISETAGQAMQLDPDTYTSPESHEIALLAAGAAIDGVERVMGGSHQAAVAMVRPPGHHAERDRAMGFCLYNNVAVAAAHARAQGAAKVAIVDYDVHHGNGTQHIFEADRQVLYISTHQFPYYPGTGAATELGREAGLGFTVNVPLEVGASDEDFQIVFEKVVTPVLRQFEPDLIIVSAGVDAHERDPLGGLRLSTAAFAAMTLELRAVAEECCRGRIVSVTEGGYDLEALAASLDAIIDAHATPTLSTPVSWPKSGRAADRGAATLATVRRAHAAYWQL